MVLAFPFCYHLSYSFARSSEVRALFFTNAFSVGMFWNPSWKRLLLGWPVARKVNSEIDNLSNKMPSLKAGTLQLLPLIKFSSFLPAEFIICTQQYFLERPLKIYNSRDKHTNYYCCKNVSFFFSSLFVFSLNSWWERVGNVSRLKQQRHVLRS